MTTKLTGAWRFWWVTTGILFKRSYLVMQVEEKQEWLEPLGGSGHFEPMTQYVWRDATVGDITSGVGAFPTGGGRING